MFYTYDSGNKLLRVSDGSNHPEGFKDGANTTIEYGYDAFGNMTRDDNKSITSITYNHLNLPKQILFSGIPNRKINYLYNALGQKVEKKITNNLTETTTNYQGMFHYENNILKFFATAEGYVNVTTGGRQGPDGPSYVFSYIYNYTDHLGNIRVSYTNNGINAAIIEENHYYPFGLKHKKYGSVDKDLVCVNEDCYEIGIDVVPPQARKSYQYKYNGMEYQDELGLNLYDYGARNYDPTIGRWMNIDPLAENSRRWSPYNYAYNNPIYFIDPDGMQAYPPTDLELENLGISIGDIQDGYQWSDTDGNWAFNGETKTWEGVNGTSVNIPAETQQIEEVEITINKRSNLSDFWNSPLARLVVPDMLGVDLSSSVTAFAGVNVNLSFNFITRGHDASFIPYVTVSPGGQGGGQISADALVGIKMGYYMASDMRSLTQGEASTGLLGWSVNGSTDVGIGVGGSVTGTIGFKQTPFLSTPTWITGGVGIGASIGGGATGGSSYSFPVFKSQFK